MSVVEKGPAKGDKPELPTLHSLLTHAKLNGVIVHGKDSSVVYDDILCIDGVTKMNIDNNHVENPSDSLNSCPNGQNSDVPNGNTDLHQHSDCDNILNQVNNNCDTTKETGFGSDILNGNTRCDKLPEGTESGAKIPERNATDLSNCDDNTTTRENSLKANSTETHRKANQAYTETEKPSESNTSSSRSLDNSENTNENRSSEVSSSFTKSEGPCESNTSSSTALDNSESSDSADSQQSRDVNSNHRHRVVFDLSNGESSTRNSDSDSSKAQHSCQFIPGERNTKSSQKVRAPKLFSRAFSMPVLARSWRQKDPPYKPQNGTTANCAAPQPLQEVRGDTTSRDNSFDKRASPRKKLTLKIPSLRKRHEEQPVANGSAPVTNNSVDRSSPKKLNKRASFPFAKKAEKHKENPRTLQGSVNTAPRPTDPTGNKNLDPEAEEKQSKGSLGENDSGCGPCNCPVPLPRKMRDYMRRNETIEGKEIRNTFVVGVTFQLIFTAHFAIQNLQSSLHEEEYLGVSALGCLYASSIFSSIFSPTIIGLLGTKKSLVLAWLCHILYTLAQFYPSWETLVPASILVGSMTGPAWTAQGLYVSACAYSFSKRSPHSPYTILSRFNGLFFTLYETRQILGNLLSSVVLKDGVANRSEEVIFKFCGPKDCPAAENVTDIEEPDAWVIDLMLGIYMALQVLGLVLTVFLVSPLSRSEWSARAPVRQTVTSWFKTLVGTEMLFLVPFMVFQAMEQGILLSEYTKSYISCPIGIHMVGFVMATHGATSAVFVFIFSRLARLTGRFALFVFAAVISLVLLVVLYDWTPNSGQQALIFSFPVLWGIGEGIWQTQTNSMIAVVFWDRKEPAFANYQTWRAVGFTFVFSFHSLLCVSTKIAIAIGLLVVGMLLYTGVEFHLRRKERLQLTQGQTDPEASDTKPARDEEPLPSSSSSSSPPVSSSSCCQVEVGGCERRLEAGGTHSLPRGLPVGVEGVEAGRVAEGLCGGLEVERAPGAATVSNLSAFQFDDTAAGQGVHLTLDGTCLTRDESAFLDNDVRVRYGVVPAAGSRPLTATLPPKSPLTAPAILLNPAAGEAEQDRWADKGVRDNWNSGSVDVANQRPTRPHTWPEHQFQDEGELKVMRTKNDVLVY